MTDRWTPQQERVALALINAAEPDPSLRYATVDDIPYPRLRSEIPFARAAIAALADDLLPELPEGWVLENVHLADVIDGEPLYEAFLSEGEPKDWPGNGPWVKPLRHGTGPTIPAAIRNALNGGDR